MSEKKVKLRMGMHNRVTGDRWQAIKDDTKRGIPVAKIAKRHSVSESTVRKVRRSKNYHEYRIEANHLRNNRQPIVVVAQKSGLPFEDYGPKPLFFSSKMLKPKNNAVSNRLDREAENTARCLGVVLAGVIGIVVLALVIVFICSLGGD